MFTSYTDVKDKDGKSPLQVAIDYVSIETAVYLLDRGCSFDSEEQQAQLLVTACGVKEVEGRLEVVKRLVEHYHCDVNGETVCGGVINIHIATWVYVRGCHGNSFKVCSCVSSCSIK